MVKKMMLVPMKVYVLSMEHYHFPPNESDMVSATPRMVAGEMSYDFLKTQAHAEARRHAEKYNGISETITAEVKEYEDKREYRVWVDSNHPHIDKFVWVVRLTDWK